MTVPILFVLTSCANVICCYSGESIFDFAPDWRCKDDCGVNAAYIVARLCRVEASLDEVRRNIPIIPSQGSSLNAIGEYLNQKGLKYSAGWVPPRDLHTVCKSGNPVIVHTEGGVEEVSKHVTVVVRFDE